MCRSEFEKELEKEQKTQKGKSKSSRTKTLYLSCKNVLIIYQKGGEFGRFAFDPSDRLGRAAANRHIRRTLRQEKVQKGVRVRFERSFD